MFCSRQDGVRRARAHRGHEVNNYVTFTVPTIAAPGVGIYYAGSLLGIEFVRESVDSFIEVIDTAARSDQG